MFKKKKFQAIVIAWLIGLTVVTYYQGKDINWLQSIYDNAIEVLITE